jgi:hypothetical protein
VVATGAEREGRLNEPHINAKLESNGARRMGAGIVGKSWLNLHPHSHVDCAYRTELRLWVYKRIIP